MLDALVAIAGPNQTFGPTDCLASALLARSETGLIALDARMQVRIANPAAMGLLGASGCADDEIVTSFIERATMLAPSSSEALVAWLRSESEAETCLLLNNGRCLSVARAEGPGGHLLLSLRLEPRAAVPPSRRDPLTGLADRAWFFDRLAGMVAEPGVNPAVLMIDLDRFKAVNDTLGHPIGDAVLQLVAKRLSRALRDDDVICRLSGDEFAVAMRQPVDAEAVSRRLVALLSRPYLVEGETATIGASIGAALAPEHGRDGAALIRAADVALYAAKRGGRGVAHMFDATLEHSARKRQSLADDLRRAVPLRQFELHFQPQMTLDTRELTGFEAFIRWRHPEHGLLLPESFIPLAEDTGLIWPIGEWVLRTACEQAITWPAHLSVAVNISPKQVIDRHRLARAVKSTLLKTALAPHRLEIEIPESALVQEAETLPVLTALRQLGVRVSLDDFGTGYSSLNQLRRFPLDKLKIDRSFVQTLGSSHEATGVVRAIAALGRSLGIATIAEGVETEDQQNRVRLDGCTEIQGYLLSKPVPAGDVRRVIASLQQPAQVAEHAA